MELHAAYFVLPCTAVIFAIGYYLGRSKVSHERESVLRALASVMQSADELSHDVDSHNTELADMGRSVDSLPESSDVSQVRDLLLDHIKDVISSNKRLEDDLVCARYTLRQQEQELGKTREEVRTDQLSQVGNRKAFDEEFDYRLSRWKRQRQSFALLICDVDHFKWINDTHGHQAGDLVVRGVGSLMKDKLSGRHFVARFGGDEFAVLIDLDDRQAAIELAREIHAAAATHNFSAAHHGERVAITFSMGLAFVTEEDTTESLFARADQKLYEAKQAGRNCLKVEAAPSKAEIEVATTVAMPDDNSPPVEVATH